MQNQSYYRRRLLSSSGAILALFLPATAFAGDLIGTVSDGSQTRALQGAELTIVELGRKAEADRDGSFRFIGLPAGTYTLEARYIGAESRSQIVTVPETGSFTANVILGGTDDILVIGQAANLASSLSRQRAADGVENVLTRDAIGQFPDQNVAESVRRLPGVNVLNDQGEGRYVSVRGLDPELNAASINGTRIPSPETESRAVGLDVISSDMIESIEIKKTLTPDMDADTIGASIEIKTTSAFDRKRDLLSLKLEGSYNNYANAVSPKAGLDFATRITDNFGIAGGISYMQRKFETDATEASGWATNAGVVNARDVRYRDYDVTRERISGTLNFDFRPSDSTKLYVRTLASQFNDQEYRGDVVFIMSGAPDATLSTGNNAYFRDSDGRIEVRRRMKDRYERQEIRSITVGGETETGPWVFTYNAAYSDASESQSGSINPTRFRARFNDNNVNVNFNYDDPRRPSYEVFGNTDRFYDPTRYAFNELELYDLSESKDQEWAVKADVAREFPLAAGTFTLQSGIKSRWRTKSYDFNTLTYGGYNGTYTLADVLGEQSYNIANILPIPSNTGPTDFFYENRDNFILDEVTTAVDSAASDYSIDEDILAAYILGRFEGKGLRVIGGVRVERTYNDINGNLIATAGNDVLITPVNFQRSYTDWLPSLSLRYDAAKDLVLRFGGSKSLVRPKLSNLAPRFTINENDVAEFGNPDLRPYSAVNLDVAAEWYFGKNSALTGGVYWKSIKDFIVRYTDNERGSAYGVDYVRATTFVNGETATVKGAEVSFSHHFRELPAPFDGLLISANYSYTDAVGTIYDNGDLSTPRQISLPASSKHNFNTSLGYEKGGFSFRAAGTYRSKYLDEIGNSAEEDRMVDQHFQLDLSAKYRINRRFRLFAEWVNVTDAPYFAYQQYGGDKRLLQYEKYSWTAKFGVTARL